MTSGFRRALLIALCTLPLLATSAASAQAVPADTDGDTVANASDLCPEVAGVTSNDGCPQVTDTDADGDGVIDSPDQCVAVPGPLSNDGCPLPMVDEVACAKAEAKVERVQDRIETLKSRDAPEKKIKRAKRKLKSERREANEACSPAVPA